MSYDYQEVISGFCYVSAAFLHWRITNDDAFMKLKVYPPLKSTQYHLRSVRTWALQIIAMPPHREHAERY